MATHAKHQGLVLRSHNGLNVGSYFPLRAGRNVLGRSPENEIPVEDSKVSREHAAIDHMNGVFHLVDLVSTNGTYLNGKRLEQSAILSVGDELRVGRTVFVIEPVEKARRELGHNWRESTNLIQVAHLAQAQFQVEKASFVSEQARVSRSETSSRLRLRPKSRVTEYVFQAAARVPDKTLGRTIALSLVILVTAAAIRFSLG
jgi:pSer/pThr/pTyr-binding forkhead associated (FHA) protein